VPLLKPNEGRIDFPLFVITAALILIGTIMVYSSSSYIADTNEKFSNHAFFLQRQLVWLLLAFVTMFAAARINLEKARRAICPSLGASLLLLGVVFFMPEIRGTHRWLSLGIFTMQPAELFRFVLVFYLAHSLSHKGRTLNDVHLYKWPYGPLVGLATVLIVLEPDLGMVLIMGATVVLLLYLAGARIRHMAIAIGGSAALFAFVVFVIGYKKARVLDFIASLSDPMLAPHQVKQSVLSIACGGSLGAGLGNGVFKQFFLPEPHTDFIFASMGEELGLFGLTIVLGLMMALIWRGIRIATMQPDRFRFLLAAGLTISLAVNIIINIAVVLGLIPTTGLTLPFLSYGGSSLVMSSVTVGVLLNLSRRDVRLAP
jgi:cell division protein FtsW